MVKLRKRDTLPPDPPAKASDIVRLEKLIDEQEPADLSPLEAELRSQKEEITRLRRDLAARDTPTPSYEFEIRKDSQGVISNVRARPVAGDTPLTKMH